MDGFSNILELKEEHNKVQFIYENADDAASSLADSLTAALDKHSRVLWLVPGGSNIAIAVNVMRAIPEALTAKLHIMLTDERYGEVDHADSNFRQLREAGFDTKQAVFIPTLQSGLSIEATVPAFSEVFERESGQAGFVIAQFGIGADGHIAGILPSSPATASQSLCVGYHTDQFDRLTLTFTALKRVDTAYACVYGDSKKPTLLQLQSTETPLAEQPCQILRHIPEAYVYNDCIAGEAITT